MYSITQYTDFFISYLQDQIIDQEPKNLYDPIAYILLLEGKRTRPVLTLITSEIFDQDYKSALPAALAIEIFHNSTLVHDDIIDNDPIRRGSPTVHTKWDNNTAILAGDAMVILVYRCLEAYEPGLAMDLIKVINKMGIDIFEGQRWDVDFEKRQDVSASEYLKMIECKTAVLIATAMKIGAIIAQTSQENRNLIYDFGLNLGLAFQLQDDYLDIFGDTPTFGRVLNGDIIANKKTYLYLMTLELVTTSEKKQLLELYAGYLEDNEKKIQIVRELYVKYKISEVTQNEIRRYTLKAFETLDKINIDESKKLLLRAFGENLMRRRM